ncbi:heparan-alpha-glucosaminide N-acetyltransferase domain-containing protein [Xanthomonas campestris pv. cannae]|nr:heparan-alpha-glucosaminide N-acetyltransferase domain-containing protein [Xanthomonas campestris pv. cannae]
MSSITASAPPLAAATASAVHARRIVSIDALRGLVMCLMLMDHVRETLYLHLQLSDPMSVADTPARVFFSRLAAHFCAPAFLFLTGLGAWLYAHPPGATPRSARAFLLKRGALIVLLEVTLVSFLWVGELPKVIYLQVMWAIGLSMIVLGFASALPRRLLLAIGLAIVCGHNAVSGVSLPPEHPLYVPWTLLLHRGWVSQDTLPQIRLTYPALPWIGVILLGWAAGPLFASQVDGRRRQRILVGMGVGCWIALLLLRGANLYGENAPWQPQATALLTLMDFLNYTKYPPSLDFLLLTLGGSCFALAAFEYADNPFSRFVSTYGGAPMFFYLLHLAVLVFGYKLLLAMFGPNQGSRFGVAPDQFWVVWVVSVALVLALYPVTRAFARYKRRTTLAWVKYF